MFMRSTTLGRQGGQGEWDKIDLNRVKTNPGRVWACQQPTVVHCYCSRRSPLAIALDPRPIDTLDCTAQTTLKDQVEMAQPPDTPGRRSRRIEKQPPFNPHPKDVGT